MIKTLLRNKKSRHLFEFERGLLNHIDEWSIEYSIGYHTWKLLDQISWFFDHMWHYIMKLLVQFVQWSGNFEWRFSRHTWSLIIQISITTHPWVIKWPPIWPGSSSIEIDQLKNFLHIDLSQMDKIGIKN